MNRVVLVNTFLNFHSLQFSISSEQRRYVKIPNEVNPNVKIPNRDWRKNPERNNPEFSQLSTHTHTHTRACAVCVCVTARALPLPLETLETLLETIETLLETLETLETLLEMLETETRDVREGEGEGEGASNGVWQRKTPFRLA